MHSKQKLVVILTLVFFLLVGGTVGYIVIEDFSFIDAFYMTVITISSVGFREVRDLSELGKIFTVFIIFGGLGTVVYGLTSITTFIIEGEFRDFIRRYRMENRMKSLQDHYIVCGGGKSGMHLAREFSTRKVPFSLFKKTRFVPSL